MEALNYLPCRDDTDVWMCKARKSDGTEYYEYMLLYVDDCLAISEAPKEAVLQLDKLFKMQPNSIAPPDVYIGSKVKICAFQIWWMDGTLVVASMFKKRYLMLINFSKILMDPCCLRRLTLPYPMTIKLKWIALQNLMELTKITINN